MENAYLKSKGLSSESEIIKPADKAAVVMELRSLFSLRELLQIAGLSRSTFYYHAKQKTQQDKYANIIPIMYDIYQKHHGRYGYRCMTAELKRQGYSINHKTVLR